MANNDFAFDFWIDISVQLSGAGVFVHHKSDKVFLLIIIKTVAVIASCKLNVITS